MITFPNAKINLGLQITEKLENGYHAINTCLFPIPWSDILEVTPDKKTSFLSTGIPIPDNGLDDLIVRAYKLLKKDYPLPELRIHLHKMICVGGGLGGGSSDAAFMLKLLNQEFQLYLEPDILEDYAGKLGSDCPFFIRNQPVYATGTGTELDPMDLDLTGLHLRMIYPGIHFSTQKAYTGVTPKPAPVDIRQVLGSNNFMDWRTHLINDFESSVFEASPELSTIKEQLYQSGAVYAAMTGSGSTLFGLFEQKPAKPGQIPHHWVIKDFIL